jgi:hypothetical protein
MAEGPPGRRLEAKETAFPSAALEGMCRGPGGGQGQASLQTFRAVPVRALQPLERLTSRQYRRACGKGRRQRMLASDVTADVLLIVALPRMASPS